MTRVVALKAFGLWVVILLLAIANGAFREGILLEALPRSTAFMASGLLLILCIFAVALLLIPWLGRLSVARYVLVGLLWVVLTVAFEFGFGLLVRGQPLSLLLEAYRFRDGNIWPLVLAVVAAAPAAAGWFRRARNGRGIASTRQRV